MPARLTLPDSSTIVYIVLAAFAIDRVASAVLFLLRLHPRFPDPSLMADEHDRDRTSRGQLLLYFLIACVLAAVVMKYPGIRVLGEPDDVTLLEVSANFILTFLILVGGAERLSALSGLINSSHSSGAGAGPAPEPLVVTGKLTLDDGGSGIRRRGEGA